MGVSACSLCSEPWEDSWLRIIYLFAACKTVVYESQEIQGAIPQVEASTAGAQMCIQVSSMETLAIWGRLVGEGRGGICWLPWSPGWMAVSPYMHAKLEAYPQAAAFKKYANRPFKGKTDLGVFCLSPQI